MSVDVLEMQQFGKHHFPTETAMQELLEKEGVRIENDKVVDWKKLFWEPGE